MSKWIAEFELEDGDTMPEHMDLEYKGGRIDFHFRPLEQELCDDWYDVPSDEMTLKQARQAVKDLRKKLVEYLEQEPTTKNDLGVDSISRQEAIDTIRQLYLDLASQKYVIDLLKVLPSVTPQEPKTGHWIDVFGGCECSECGDLEPGYSDYCPNCGAKMIESQESEG